ncbi:MAG: hypothetical protein ABIJ91_04735 [Candidatus Kuenenbacteria bacterium]
MALNTNQQIQELLRKSKNILITTAAKDTGDGLCAALALEQMFKKISLPSDVVSTSQAAKKLAFLPNSDKIKSNIASLKKFIISLDITNNKINEFSYDIQDNKLNIFVTPEKNILNKDSLSISSSSFKYDVIITINAPDLESLGSLYEKNTDFFYSTPIINIDTDPSNEYFGQINLVDLNSISSTQIIFNFISSVNPKLLDKNIATKLLAGIIIKTKSFKDPRTTPMSLSLAADLIKIGGEREMIVNNLYGNKKLSTLNLWGRILARLKQDSLYKMAWSIISQTDFEKAGAAENDIQGIAEEILLNSPQIEIILILYETKSGQIAAEIHTSKNYNALELTRAFNPLGNESRADFYLETDKLFEAEEMTVNEIRSRIKT